MTPPRRDGMRRFRYCTRPPSGFAAIYYNAAIYFTMMIYERRIIGGHYYYRQEAATGLFSSKPPFSLAYAYHHILRLPPAAPHYDVRRRPATHYRLLI